MQKEKLQILLGLIISSLFVSCTIASESKPNECHKQEVLAEFTFTKGENIILLPVKFRDKEYLFLLDTGSSHTVFDTSFKEVNNG